MITLDQHGRGPTRRTFVWDRSALYIFPCTIKNARVRADREGAGLVRGPDVVDVPSRCSALVWVGHMPYLFPGSLTAASERGRAYKHRRKFERQDRAGVSIFYARMEAAGFEAAYARHITED